MSSDREFAEFWNDVQSVLDAVLDRFEKHFLEVHARLDALAAKEVPGKDDVKYLIRDALSRIVQRLRAYGRRSGLFSAMTIYQAKNQEFDDVLVLWPYQVSGSDEKLRRLLYNAVTRARRRAMVIVQNNAKKDNRLAKPPFTP